MHTKEIRKVLNFKPKFLLESTDLENDLIKYATLVQENQKNKLDRKRKFSSNEKKIENQSPAEHLEDIIKRLKLELDEQTKELQKAIDELKNRR